MDKNSITAWTSAQCWPRGRSAAQQKGLSTSRVRQHPCARCWRRRAGRPQRASSECERSGGSWSGCGVPDDLKQGEGALWSRNGNEKTAQFPEVVRALESAAAGLKQPVVLDGEVVALDGRGGPAGFQRLQGRMHLRGEKDVRRAETVQPAIFIAFDILQDGKDDLTRLPLTERRTRLERFSNTIRISEQVAGDHQLSEVTFCLEIERRGSRTVGHGTTVRPDLSRLKTGLQ